MIVALHGAPKSFFKTDPPHTNDELLRLIRKTASLSFKAVEIGPLANYEPINGKHVKKVLDDLDLERSMHVGGLFDASKFAFTEEEHQKMKQQLRSGIALCSEIASKSLSVHPPFLANDAHASQELLLKARTRFLELLEKQIDYADHHEVKLAIESFCYPPFIFKDINDFASFVFNFPEQNLEVLLDIGHLYQIGISLSQAVHMFKNRLADIHIHDATLEKDYRKATHLPIGKGTIDFPSLIRLLTEIHYDGWLTLEIRGDEKEILESKKRLETLIVQA